MFMRAPRLLICALALTLAAGACALPGRSGTEMLQPGAPTLDDTLAVILGRSVVTRDGAVRVTFVEKLSDSRCAMGVVCVWAGDVGARLRVETIEVAGEQPVRTGVEPRTLDVGGYRVWLLNVTPVPGDKAAQPHVASVRVVRPIPR